MKVSLDVFKACCTIAFADDTTQHERDAAAEAVKAYRLGKPVDKHIVSVLAGYVAKQSQQDRYGR